MKTLRLLAATLLGLAGAATAVAAPPAPPANANFATERGQAFGLRLDGQPLTRPLARQVHVDRLAPGQHWADFSLPTPFGPPMRFRTQVWLAPGLETSYVLVMRPGFGPQLRQVGAVPVAGPGYGPGPGSYGGYTGYPPPAPGGPAGGAPGGYYGGQPAAPNYPSYPNNPPYGNGNDPTGGYGGAGQPAEPSQGNGYPGGYGTAPVPNSSNGYPGGYDPNNAPGNGYPGGYDPNNAPAPTPGGAYPNQGNGGYLYPLPPADVQNLAQALRNQPTDEQRLSMAKQALAQGTVQANELAELISALSFDRARIDLAKYGYAHLSDPQNFYRVYDVLRYASSIREVQQALGLPQN